MEFVALLRVLWRHRIAVVLGALLAIGVGFVISKGAASHLGVASVRVALDTPASQLVDVKPDGADTLEWRAALLADLAGSDSLRPRIARAMHIPADRLVVTAAYLNAPPIATPLPVKALEAAAAAAQQPYVLAVQAVATLPIIVIDARAPTRAEAARLAGAGADTLKAAAAAHRPALGLQEFLVNDVGPVRAKAITDGPRRLVAAGVTMSLFILWCAGVMLVSGLGRARRTSRRIRLAETAWR